MVNRGFFATPLSQVCHNCNEYVTKLWKKASLVAEFSVRSLWNVGSAVNVSIIIPYQIVCFLHQAKIVILGSKHYLLIQSQWYGINDSESKSFSETTKAANRCYVFKKHLHVVQWSFSDGLPQVCTMVQHDSDDLCSVKSFWSAEYRSWL